MTFFCRSAPAICTLLAMAGIAAGGQESAAPSPASPATPLDPAAIIEGGLKPLADRGATLQVAYQGGALAGLSGGYARGGTYEALLTVSLKLDLRKLVSWNGATFYVSGLDPQGTSLTGRYVHDYNVVNSVDASYNSVRLFELWLQQALWDGKFTIRIGQLTTDNDFFNSPNAALYINSIFGTMGPEAHNADLPTYPLASEGVRVHADLTPSLYLQAISVNDNPGFPATDNHHGVRFGFNSTHGVLSYLEAGYTPPQAANATMPGADYKVGGFYDTQFHPDVATATDSHGTYGFYLMTDQPLYTAPGSTADSPRGVAGFARFSAAPDQRNPVVYYFDAGLNGTGLLPGRPKDVLGAAFSFERLGTDVQLASGAPVISHHEHVIELTYLANLTDHLAIQPDIQYIINPGGFYRTPNALVAGVMFNLTF
jgi:porin